MIAFLRNLIFQDFWLKFFSLALAILIWVTVSLAIPKEVTDERTFYHVPVLVMSSAADVHNFKASPGEVDVTVKGEPGILQKLQAGEIHALVDLTGFESALDLPRRIEISTPPGVSHARVSPEEVRVLAPPKR